MESCEYCGEVASHVVDGVVACSACYNANFGVMDETKFCAVCDEVATLCVDDEPYCRQCFDDDESLTEDDIDQ